MKTYLERLDPTCELRHAAAAFLNSPAAQMLVESIGAGAEHRQLREEYNRLISDPDRISVALAPHGWILFEDSPLGDYAAAATLIERGEVERAEELLVRTWNDEEHMLNRIVTRVVALYWGDEEREAIGQHRRRLLLEALSHHRSGLYGGSVALVLTQMDGIFIDITNETRPGYSLKPANPNLLDNETLVGHPLGLRALSTLLSKRVVTTSASGELVRHGILHGRELAFDTLVNSTKAWVALLCLVNSVKHRADGLGQQAADARAQRYAGSKDVDEWGQRLDRRGFEEAKRTLNDLAGSQGIHHSRFGSYAEKRAILDPSGLSLGQRAFEMELREDGQEFWAWRDTPTGLVVGIAGQDGEWTVWHYQGDEPPAGGVGSDADWRHVVNDPALPDW